MFLCRQKRLRHPVLYCVKQEAVPTVTAEELEELLSDFLTCDSWLYYWGEPERAPHLRGERRFCLFVYIYIHTYIYIYVYMYIYIQPAQVAQCQHQLGHKYRSGMQQPNAGSKRARSALRWCPCASCIWLLHPAPILVPKLVLTLCNLRWWCFSFHQLAKILHLQSWSSSPAATCAGDVFPWSTSAFTNVRTNE